MDSAAPVASAIENRRLVQHAAMAIDSKTAQRAARIAAAAVATASVAAGIWLTTVRELEVWANDPLDASIGYASAMNVEATGLVLLGAGVLSLVTVLLVEGHRPHAPVATERTKRSAPPLVPSQLLAQAEARARAEGDSANATPLPR